MQIKFNFDTKKDEVKYLKLLKIRESLFYKSYKITNRFSEILNDSFSHEFGIERYNSYISGSFSIEIFKFHKNLFKEIKEHVYDDIIEEIIFKEVGKIEDLSYTIFDNKSSVVINILYQDDINFL